MGVKLLRHMHWKNTPKIEHSRILVILLSECASVDDASKAASGAQ